MRACRRARRLRARGQSVVPKSTLRAASRFCFGVTAPSYGGVEERLREIARVLIGRPHRRCDEIGEPHRIGLGRRKELSASTPMTCADPAPEVDVALGLLGVDADAELAQAVDDRDREEERRARPCRAGSPARPTRLRSSWPLRRIIRRTCAWMRRTLSVICHPSANGRMPPGRHTAWTKRAVSLSRRSACSLSRPERTSGLLPPGDA